MQLNLVYLLQNRTEVDVSLSENSDAPLWPAKAPVFPGRHDARTCGLKHQHVWGACRCVPPLIIQCAGSYFPHEQSCLNSSKYSHQAVRNGNWLRALITLPRRELKLLNSKWNYRPKDNLNLHVRLRLSHLQCNFPEVQKNTILMEIHCLKI